MKILRIHHVAFAHPGDSTVLGALEQLLGLGCSHQEAAPGFNEAMVAVGDGFVQLLAGTGAGGVVDRFLERRGPALHHVAFEVDDVRGAVAGLICDGVRMIDAEPRRGGMGTTIAFVHPEAFGGLLVELVEVNERP